MLDVFRQEVEAQASIINQGLSSLENQPPSPQILESMVRALNAIKGAARLIELDAAMNLAMLLEDSFNAAQKQTFALDNTAIELLQQGINFIVIISQANDEEIESCLSENQENIQLTQENIAALIAGQPISASSPKIETKTKTKIEPPRLPAAPKTPTVKASAAVDLPSQQPTVVPESPADHPSPVVESAPPTKESVTVPIDPPMSTASEESSSVTDSSMLDLFRLEVEAQTNILNEGLLALEGQPDSPKALEALMRAAHSIKGAARIVAMDAAVGLAHVMEDCFVAAQKQTITLDPDGVDVMLHAVDLLINISQQGPTWIAENRPDIEITRQHISGLLTPGAAPVKRVETQTAPKQETSTVLASVPQPATTAVTTQAPAEAKLTKSAGKEIEQAKSAAVDQAGANADRVVRVSADNLNRIMGLAGETLIEANWLQPFADSLVILKKRQLELSKVLENFQQALAAKQVEEAESLMTTARTKERECREILGERLDELELYARRTGSLSDRLYREVIASNMRPFADGVQGFPRMIRDLARKLNKQVKFEVFGKATPVDRDIIKKLEAPLTHILRNSIDHGLELPDERIASGKPAEGTVRLEAVHRGGMLSITISDDGRGVDLERLRQKVINKGLANPEIAAKLSESELLEFLFLPGFSTAKQVTEISGRGVGLDIAKSMAHEVGGTVRANSQFGKGCSFNFQLPLTLSVVRTLLVEVSGEPYAFPLARIEQIVMVDKQEISSVENRQYFTMNNRNIGLVAAYQVLELKQPPPQSETLSVVVISEQSDYYGLVVDRFLGEHDLVVRPLDNRLGKVQDISAAALMGDGTPILIVDVSDLMRSVDNILDQSQLRRIVSNTIDATVVDQRKSILVVDDSITVREMERKLLQNKGYKVDVAVDGMEGWHAVSTNSYDLVISDVDMPRMNGIELVSRIKAHSKYSSIPVIIVSYKDREEDRLRGLEAGADYYLTKSSFDDDTLINAVYDLVGH